jgi:hypothetical protein
MKLIFGDEFIFHTSSMYEMSLPWFFFFHIEFRTMYVLPHDTPTNSCIFYLELKDMHSSFHHSSRMKYVFASDTMYMFVSAMLSKL